MFSVTNVATDKKNANEVDVFETGQRAIPSSTNIVHFESYNELHGAHSE
jgi:hypothetical protein